jgi:hypothetical protein
VPTPVHGDLAGEHVLAHEGRVTGVLDWGEARVADPADDLAWVAASATPAAVDTVIEAYSLARGNRPDPHLLDRARLAGELALARWLLGGVAAEDAQVVDAATRALERLAEVVRAEEARGGGSVVAGPGHDADQAMDRGPGQQAVHEPGDVDATDPDADPHADRNAASDVAPG